MDYYVEDSADARRNRLTFIGTGTSPVYTSVLSYKFSNEDITEPVTIDEAKDWCAVEGEDRDNMITLLISAARKKIEKLKQISLVNRTVTAKITPGTDLPYGPVIEIISIADEYGSVNDYDGNPYHFNNMPCTRTISITYTAGPGDNGASEDFKIEVLQQVAFMLENRGDDKSGSGGISPMIKGNNRINTRYRQ